MGISYLYVILHFPLQPNNYDNEEKYDCIESLKHWQVRQNLKQTSFKVERTVPSIFGQEFLENTRVQTIIVWRSIFEKVVEECISAWDTKKQIIV